MISPDCFYGFVTFDRRRVGTDQKKDRSMVISHNIEYPQIIIFINGSKGINFITWVLKYQVMEGKILKFDQAIFFIVCNTDNTYFSENLA